jgi:hypothetical protein
MALIVEDGTGLANAESYISTIYARTYHAARGNAAWADLTVAEMEEALRKATDYMVSEYRFRWVGDRVKITQALDWPRGGVLNVDVDDIPEEVKKACAEFALKSLSGPLLEDLSQSVIAKSVGSLSVSYDRNSSQRKRYIFIDSLLSVYLCSIGYAHTRLAR